MNQLRRSSAAVIALAGTLLFLACSADQNPTAVIGDQSQVSVSAPPGELVRVAGLGDLGFWPFTSSTLRDPEDPINLVFAGESDPRAIRTALMRLGGDRTAYGFPAGFPFDCTWSDAIGDVQGAFTERTGWTGSAIQLACGPYGPLRFHLRLFDAGKVILGNAHFDLQIPGTADHRVVSWEVAKQLVTVDMMRTGLLSRESPVTQSQVITTTPSYGTFEWAIYQGLPEGLKQLLGSLVVHPGDPVPVPNDGRAQVFHVARHPEGTGVGSFQDFLVQYGIVFPKPFCAVEPGSLVQVEGPVRLVQRVVIGEAGAVVTTFRTEATLKVTPFDPAIGAYGTAYQAEVTETHDQWANAERHVATRHLRQALVPGTGPDRGVYEIRIRVSSDGRNSFDRTVACGATPDD